MEVVIQMGKEHDACEYTCIPWKQQVHWNGSCHLKQWLGESCAECSRRITR